MSWIIIRKSTVVARLIAMPYAAPPRCVLVASGAPKRAMMMQVTGTAIFCASSTLSSLALPPERCSAVTNRRSSANRMSSGILGRGHESAGASRKWLSRPESNDTTKS